MEPDTFLERCAHILAERLEAFGYTFTIAQPTTNGSGGPFARGVFRRGDRQIQLWARYDRLGGVVYRVGDDEFTHQAYMRAIGLEKTAHWPRLNDGDPLGGFERLLRDFAHCAEFLMGDAALIVRRVRALPPNRTGFKALAS